MSLATQIQKDVGEKSYSFTYRNKGYLVAPVYVQRGMLGAWDHNEECLRLFAIEDISRIDPMPLVKPLDWGRVMRACADLISKTGLGVTAASSPINQDGFMEWIKQPWK